MLPGTIGQFKQENDIPEPGKSTENSIFHKEYEIKIKGLKYRTICNMI